MVYSGGHGLDPPPCPPKGTKWSVYNAEQVCQSPVLLVSSCQLPVASHQSDWSLLRDHRPGFLHGLEMFCMTFFHSFFWWFVQSLSNRFLTPKWLQNGPQIDPQTGPKSRSPSIANGVQKHICLGIVFATILHRFSIILGLFFVVLGFALSIDLAKCKDKQNRKKQGSASKTNHSMMRKYVKNSKNTFHKH